MVKQVIVPELLTAVRDFEMEALVLVQPPKPTRAVGGTFEIKSTKSSAKLRLIGSTGPGVGGGVRARRRLRPRPRRHHAPAPLPREGAERAGPAARHLPHLLPRDVVRCS